MLDNTSKISFCNICLLAETKKDCKNCPFNPGTLELKPSGRDTVSKIELLKENYK